MAIVPMLTELLKQMILEPATNAFPARYLPPSVTEFLKSVGRGEAKIHPPVETPPKFRGKIVYDRDLCIGCTLCLRVCPAHAIEFLPQTKKIRIWVTQCIFCSQCNDVCPKSALHMSEEFLLATEDRFGENMIVE
ncbi:MAG: 4Fe-4S binding protein [Methanomicrobiales archaeon]|nr:4Fe-4S binding protein [Methanomicrobiales archaeon]